jgi:putative sterol carrier protein
MVRFLSEEWIQALDRSARQVDVTLGAATDSPIVVEQTVTHPSAAAVTYQLAIDHGSATVVAGPVHDPTVTLRTDRATAEAIARGTLSAQQAFVQGRLRVGGDVRALVRHAPALAQLDEGFAIVRDETVYADA